MKRETYREQGQLTVGELIALLQEYPPDAIVWTEGCDCVGAADRVEYSDPSDKSQVIIGRCN